MIKPSLAQKDAFNFSRPNTWSVYVRNIQGAVSEVELENYAKCLRWLIDHLGGSTHDLLQNMEDPEDITILESVLREMERYSHNVKIFSIIEEGVGVKYRYLNSEDEYKNCIFNY
jgi:hypothetical protein